MDIIEELRKIKKRYSYFGVSEGHIIWPKESYDKLYEWMIRNGYKVPEYGKSFRCMGFLNSLDYGKRS